MSFGWQASRRWAKFLLGGSLARAITTSRYVLLLLTLWIAVLALPTSAATWFDGVPFSSIPEAAAIAAALPLLFSGAHRQLLARAFRRGNPWYRRFALGAAVAALTFKLLLLAAPPAGFVACYQSTLTAPPAGPCERSFENPFNRFAATRIDRTIDFGPGDWNLTFFNSLRFNFYAWEKGARRRDRLPFSAVWRGVVQAPGAPILITYVGEGSVAVDGIITGLPRAYDSAQKVRLSIPAGSHRLQARYTFDDGSRTGDQRRLGPYATFRLTAEYAPPAPVVSAAAPPWARTSAVITDVLVSSIIVALLCWYGWLLRRYRRGAAIVATAATAVIVAGRRAAIGVNAATTIVSWIVLAAILRRNRTTTLLVAYAIMTAAVVLLAPANRRIATVGYRSGGNDWLTYESQARSVLEEGLRGGEDVYYNQPLFRYVRFAEHFIFGDGDFLIDSFGRAALPWSLLWAVSVLVASQRLLPVDRAAAWISAALTLALANWAPVSALIGASLSEYATWIFLAAAFALLASRYPHRWTVGAALLAAALITRPNQALALAAALGGFFVLHVHGRAKLGLAIVAAFVMVCALPLAHNVYYGHRFVIFTTTASNPAALTLPPSALARVTEDASVRALIGEQIRALIFLPPWLPLAWNRDNVMLHGLQILWAVEVWRLLRTAAPMDARILAAVPALYLIVHVMYDAVNYYPRHEPAAYFAMGLVTVAVSASRTRTTRALREAT